MSDAIPAAAGYYLDEYDGERFWGAVNFRGGQEYKSDPLVTAAGECWIRGGGGYGRFRVFGTWAPAHRIAFKDFGHDLPDDLDVDHLCRVHGCVNPGHLEAVRDTVNLARGKRGREHVTHCPHGHQYTQENTLVGTRGDRTFRRCRTCLAESAHKTYLRRKAAV